jgi:hypothetical protein
LPKEKFLAHGEHFGERLVRLPRLCKRAIMLIADDLFVPAVLSGDGLALELTAKGTKYY